MFRPRVSFRFYSKLYATKRHLIQCAPLRVNVETSSYTSWTKYVVWPKHRFLLVTGVVLWTEWYHTSLVETLRGKGAIPVGFHGGVLCLLISISSLCLGKKTLLPLGFSSSWFFLCRLVHWLFCGKE